ncbi:hypothetical protein AB1K56_02915 [Microbacterium sp. BWR-S6Y]|uniref:hypothetical protein n=1 Tax=Microbacterium sp. BWR-S6Y TaxID=3232073 RepID=UPI003527FB0C
MGWPPAIATASTRTRLGVLVREADEHGVLRRRLSAHDLRSPFHGVRVTHDHPLTRLEDRCRRDADRWRAIAREGWTLIRVVAHHLNAPQRDVVTPVARALGAAELH